MAQFTNLNLTRQPVRLGQPQVYPTVVGSGADVSALAARVTALEARADALEAIAIDHEARIAALEP